jgi:hypothetical protein
LQSTALLLAAELFFCAEYQGHAGPAIMLAQNKSQIPVLNRIWLRRRVMKSLKILLQNSAIALHSYIEYKPS